jgi:nitrite reductase (NADH) large subunit
MKKMKLVVVGNGMAGIRAVEELLKIAPDLYDITVFGAEPHPNYNRILLSPVLAGEQTVDQIILNPLSWYAEHGITLHTGKKVTTIDRIKRLVIADDGTTAPYDRLLLATGSNPFVPPVPGRDLQGVIAYRDIADTHTMIDAAATHRHAVVIGGGLLGLEAANGLTVRGMAVTVVHIMPWLMERQLDAVAGKLLQGSLEQRGLKFLIGAQTAELLGYDSGRVRAVRFKDGSEIAADLVVMAAGIRPNTELAERAGLHCNRGIVVNDTLQTITDPRVYAVGECAAHRGVAYGLVAPLFEQGKVCATHLAQFGIGRYSGSQTSTKLKVTGIDLFSAGNFMGGEGTEEIVLSDPLGGVYKKLVLQNDKLVGACLYGDTVDGSWYFKLLREGRPIGDLRDRLMFGESNIGDVGHEGHNRAAAMADADEVCGCNGVNKGTICKAIKSKGLFTLEEVRKQTKASASCGSCTGLVEQLLMFTAGGDYSKAPAKKAMCGCTDASPQEAREAIRAEHLLTIDSVYRRMGWRTPNGCSSCRPAINYYLISTWPKEARDDPQSRFINERSHANIQKDGTYSVVPRMWGGETTADELRRIADVVDKYKIPTVKVTGGQRIDLLGVKKEDLVHVWRDIGMPSGHAYAKALRTVKTCVGSEWCRFGTQDSTQMGKDLERALAHVRAPRSACGQRCPRSCAEAGIGTSA